MPRRAGDWLSESSLNVMWDINQNLTELFGSTALLLGVIAISLWSVVWKGFALYRAGARGHKGWFIALFLINTVGILEILYLTIFSRRGRGR